VTSKCHTLFMDRLQHLEAIRSRFSMIKVDAHLLISDLFIDRLGRKVSKAATKLSLVER